MNQQIDFGQGITYNPLTDKFHYEGNLKELNLDRPLTAIVELTYRCNLKCGFCKNSDTDNRIPPYNKTVKYLESLSPGGSHIRTVITGGEPFIRSDIEDILRYGCDLGHVQNVVTNGILLKPTSSLVNTVNIFEVGLDGPTLEIYQSVRGTYSYRKVTENIRRLVDLGATVRITYLLTRKNAEFAKDMPQLCQELGVNKLRLQRFMRYGRGAKNFGQYELLDEELLLMVEKTKTEAKRFGIELRTPSTKKYCYGALFITTNGDIIFKGGNGNRNISIKLGSLNEDILLDVWTQELAESHKEIMFSPTRV